MTNYEKAVALINTVPLPDDAEAQLDALSDAEKDELDKVLIASLGEALFETRYNDGD